MIKSRSTGLRLFVRMLREWPEDSCDLDGPMSHPVEPRLMGFAPVNFRAHARLDCHLQFEILSRDRVQVLLSNLLRVNIHNRLYDFLKNTRFYNTTTLL